MRFGHATTPRQIGVTSRSRARSCSPDSVQCAKIRKKSRNLTYLVILLVYMRRYLAKMSGFPCYFGHTTTPRLFGATSQTTAQNTSPDSVECAKISLAPRNLTYPVACLILCHENLYFQRFHWFCEEAPSEKEWFSSRMSTEPLDTSSFVVRDQFSHTLRSQEKCFAPLFVM